MPEDSVILVPRGAEARAIKKAAPHARVVETRAGAHAAGIPGTFPPGLVVVMGLCGALADLRPGTCVIYRDVADDGGLYSYDTELVGALHARLPRAVLVSACTTGHVVTRMTERSALAAAYSATAVDMEGTHIARALAARGRASLTVRIVSDDASYDLPPIENAFTKGGDLRPLHLALAFAKNPVAATRFIRDAQYALRVLGEVAARLTR